MSRPPKSLAALIVAATMSLPLAAQAGQAEVTGLTGEEMLKLRAGPGTGFRIIVGLPNGTRVRTHGCDRIGGTPWCKISLSEARSLKGYVSGHYLAER
ncbi:SH3 domain-containing protein [Tropicimonas sp.]|uniref:SH3 domain-containing protein n=1 Tax=Tropicimonas sp. TaxID=2067044 RepID=UPI003A89A7B2